MPSIITRDKLLNEIKLLPNEMLSDVYKFIHSFRLEIEKNNIEENADIMSFSGRWQDLDNEMFEDLLSDIEERRSESFADRRANAGFSD